MQVKKVLTGTSLHSMELYEVYFMLIENTDSSTQEVVHSSQKMSHAWIRFTAWAFLSNTFTDVTSSCVTDPHSFCFLIRIPIRKTGLDAGTTKLAKKFRVKSREINSILIFREEKKKNYYSGLIQFFKSWVFHSFYYQRFWIRIRIEI